MVVRLQKMRSFALLGAAMLLFAPGLIWGNTYNFSTAQGATISNGTIFENAQLTFITLQDELIIQVTNLQVLTSSGTHSGTDAQAINSIDWSFQGLAGSSLNPVLWAWSGEIGNLDNSNPSNFVTVTNGWGGSNGVNTGTIANRWAPYTTTQASGAGPQIPNGIQITTISGGTPNQIIMGPPNVDPNIYYANNSLVGHDPILRTYSNTYVQFVITFKPGSGVTSDTVVNAARLTFSTAFSTSTELDLKPKVTPEPASLFLIPIGALLLVAHRRLRPRRGSLTNNR